MEVRHAFLMSGGERFQYIPCLNDDSAWITALGKVAVQHMAGWPNHDDVAARAASAQAARAMGALR